MTHPAVTSILLKTLIIILALLISACGGVSGGSGTGPMTPPPGNTVDSVEPAPEPQIGFTDVTADSGLAYQVGLDYGSENEINDADVPVRDIATSGAAAGDYDNDGDIDLFIVRGNVGANLLFRNDCNLQFTDVAETAGVALLGPGESTSRQVGPVFADVDGDGDLDLFMRGIKDPALLLRNNGDGTFENRTDVEVLIDGNGMGSAVGDYDHDGDLDWFVTSILHPSEERVENAPLSHFGNRLYQNHQGVFSDVTDEAGVADGGWGWGACFMDFENDGDLDIYHTNGWQEEVISLREFPDFHGYQMDTSRAFVNQSDGTFVEQSEDLGLHDTEMGRGVVCADFDNDGDTDILLLADRPILWRNDELDNEYLKVRLIGTPPNTEAVGARIILSSENTSQIREISIGSNFLSQNPAIQLFGLGSDTRSDLTVIWPDGSETVRTDVASGQTMELTQ